MADENYEHWPNDPKLAAMTAEPVPRYDSRNGFHEHTYRPSGEVKVPAPAVPKQDAGAPTPPPQYMPYPQMMGGQMPYLAYPMPAYYGYGHDRVRVHGHHPLPSAAPPCKEKGQETADEKFKEKDDSKAPSPRKWQGRTRAEVEEDDMKIAASEGAYAPRKVAPVGMADDQMVWVVEVDDSTTLRTFAEVREWEGEWKLDPRFKEAWYFVRERKEDEGKEKK